MTAFVNSIPLSLWVLFTAVISMLGGAYLSRKKDSAEMTTKNIEGAQMIWDKYDRDIARLTNRVASLEHNEAMNDHRMREMEIAQGTLKEELRQKNDKIQELLAQIENGSSPELRAKE